VLVLDEPTAGVDAEAQAALAELLEDLHRDLRATILYVSHEFGAVEPYVDRLVLVNGSVVFAGPPANLPAPWHDPSHVHSPA
jgi:ABC-type Mn2+/Zn2+ transport system ATPase subunit